LRPRNEAVRRETAQTLFGSSDFVGKTWESG
jgi:hypothetical protein